MTKHVDPVLKRVWLPLLREALAQQGHVRWRLRGDSMAPTLPTDCEIEIAPLPPSVRPGSLVVFGMGDALVAHRLVRRTTTAWILQGDGRRAPDLPLDPGQALGVVTAAYQTGSALLAHGLLSPPDPVLGGPLLRVEAAAVAVAECLPLN